MRRIDTAAYLARIGYDGPTTIAVETLRDLHLAHVRSVPFENLDIIRGRRIDLNERAIVNKIVVERRGGFCYEVNGGFAALLRSLGFRVRMLSAGVRRDDGTFGPEFDHLLLRVDLDRPWIADVSTFIEPLALIDGVQHDGRNRYRLDRDGDYLIVMQQDVAGAWSPRFRFTLYPRSLDEFVAMSLFHQTSPESHFTHSRICSRATPDGRVSLTDGRLIISTDGQRQETPLADEVAFTDALREHFDITLPSH